VCSVGSFSKIVAPGLRTAWVHTKASLYQQISESPILVSGGGFCSLESALLADAVQNDSLKDHLKNVRAHYAHLAGILVSELKNCSELEFEIPKGGFFMWVKVNEEKVDVEAFFQELANCDIVVLRGSCCSVSEGYNNFFRLCFAYLSEEELVYGARKLQNLLLAPSNARTQKYQSPLFRWNGKSRTHQTPPHPL